jgi:hypothetical protein
MIFSFIPFFPPRFGNKHNVESQKHGLKRIAGKVEKKGVTGKSKANRRQKTLDRKGPR